MKLLSLITILMFGINLSAQIDPSNNCTGVPTLTQNATCVNNAYDLEGTIYTSTGGGFAGSCATNGNRDDGWYQFVATNTSVEIDLTGNRRHAVSVWTSCGGGTELGCDQANGGNTAILNLTGLTVGTTYYIFIERRQSNNNADMTGDICVHTPVVTPTDCVNAIQICSNSGFPGNSSGSGTQELSGSNRGCLLSNENQSSWYLLSIGTSGTLQFTISPDNGTDDYDFGVWGPAANCPPTTTPIRCSYAAGGGNTGVNTGINGESPQNSENSGGDKYVDDMNVIAGEVYILLVDNFSSTTSPFTLTFGGSATMSCVPLPIELAGFYGEIQGSANLLSWTTKSESNNAYFTIEKSYDGINWEVIAYEPGANNSTEELDYTYRDFDINNKITYYKLSQTDYDGSSKEVGKIALNNADPSKKLLKIVNLMGEFVGPEYQGIKVYIYSDGSVIKRVGN